MKLQFLLYLNLYGFTICCNSVRDKDVLAFFKYSVRDPIVQHFLEKHVNLEDVITHEEIYHKYIHKPLHNWLAEVNFFDFLFPMKNSTRKWTEKELQNYKPPCMIDVFLKERRQYYKENNRPRRHFRKVDGNMWRLWDMLFPWRCETSKCLKSFLLLFM